MCLYWDPKLGIHSKVCRTNENKKFYFYPKRGIAASLIHFVFTYGKVNFGMVFNLGLSNPKRFQEKGTLDTFVQCTNKKN